MSSTNKKTESFFARYSWIVFFLLGLIITLFGFGDMLSGGATFESGEAPTVQGISGMTWQELGAASPNAASMIDYLVRAGGAHLFILGLLSMVVAVTAFRRGERWAWYAMWLWPLWLVLIIVLLAQCVQTARTGYPAASSLRLDFYCSCRADIAPFVSQVFSKGQSARAANQVEKSA